MTLRTLIWTTIRLVPEEAMDAHLSARTRPEHPLLMHSIRAATVELEWPHTLPERGQEWCITESARTELENVEWWPGETPPCRVLHMRDVYVTSEEDYAETVDALTAAGGRNPYAP